MQIYSSKELEELIKSGNLKVVNPEQEGMPIKAKKQNAKKFNLVGWALGLIAFLMLLLPIINVNFIIGEANLSIANILLSKSETITIEQELSATLASSYLGVPLEAYENFYMNIIGSLDRLSGETNILTCVQIVIVDFILRVLVVLLLYSGL